MVAVEIRVSKSHLNGLKNGKGFNMTREEHDNPNNHMIQIHYRDAKNARKIHRTLTKGKGVRINPMHMIDCIHNGGSLWGRITHGIEHVVSNPVFKAVAPILLNAGVSAATENPEAGMIAGNVGSAALNANGSGLRRHKGKGFFDTMKKIAENKATKSIARSLAPSISKIVEEKTGSQLAGNLADGGINAYAGSGIRRRRKRGNGIITDNIDNFLSHGLGLNHNVGLGGTSSSVVNSINDKMAWVRSHRKTHQGGSFAPLN